MKKAAVAVSDKVRKSKKGKPEKLSKREAIAKLEARLIAVEQKVETLWSFMDRTLERLANVFEKPKATAAKKAKTKSA